VPLPGGGYRLFYTAVGPGKPFSVCQGYILSAVSADGVNFQIEPGIRMAPDPAIEHGSLRYLAPTVTQLADGRWRMYFESRGPVGIPTVIASAISSDLVEWELEEGIRLQGFNGIGGPRYVKLPDGRGRLYCFATQPTSKGVISAVTEDGLNFELEPGNRMEVGQSEIEAKGISAADVVPPAAAGEPWLMLYSGWQDAPPGTILPPHPSLDPNAVENGLSENFAAVSIAFDLMGFRSRIFAAHSSDGLVWERDGCVIEGGGLGTPGIDAVHAEDMSFIRLNDGSYRVYYASCDTDGNWRIASAVTE